MRIAKRVAVLIPLAFTILAFAEGTQTWRENTYDEFSKGTPKGIAIRSDGTLEMAPSFKSITTLPSTFIWSVVSDHAGNMYIATGAPARVYQITADGKATVIFQPKELQVQALALDPNQKDGVLYAATSPDGKVYRIERGSPGAKNAQAGDSQANDSMEHPGVGKSQTGAATNNETKDGATVKDKDKDKDRPALSSVAVDPQYGASVVFDPKTKYIWDLALAPDNANLLYIATGDRGEIFRVTLSAGANVTKKTAAKDNLQEESTSEGSVFFKSDESHIRTLAFDATGNLIAGSDGSGLIYRISPTGEAFVIYSAPKKEITALAIDDAGNIYAAGIGEKRSGTTPAIGPSSAGGPFAAPGASGSSVANPPSSGNTISLSGFAGSFSSPEGRSGSGSEIYVIAPDGSPTRLWSSKEDIVYALGFDARGRLLAGTGNKGRIITLETKNARDQQSKGTFVDLVKASATQVTGFAKAPGNALYVVTSNLGKVFLLGPELEKEGTFESDVFDARTFSLWGRAEIRGSGNFDIYARSGNVDNPDRNWSTWRKLDLGKDARLDAPSARFIQWKAVMKPSSDQSNLSQVESVAINYLSKNVAPVIDDVTVHSGVRGNAATSNIRSSTETVAAALGRAQNQNSSGTRFDSASSTPRDHGSITVRWSAHDDNDDTLTYSLYYKGDGESRWKLLKDKITEKSHSWDSGLLPDGGYTVRVVASDASSHSPEEALSDFKDSARFEIDNTAPRIDALSAKLEGAQLHISFSASDTFSPIHHAEFSVDAGEWQYIAPVGELSDALVETYDFNSTLPAQREALPDEKKKAKRVRSKKSGGGNGQESNGADALDDYSSSPALSNEHIIVVRVYDRFENVAIAKVVVK